MCDASEELPIMRECYKTKEIISEAYKKPRIRKGYQNIQKKIQAN